MRKSKMRGPDLPLGSLKERIAMFLHQSLPLYCLSAGRSFESEAFLRFEFCDNLNHSEESCQFIEMYYSSRFNSLTSTSRFRPQPCIIRRVRLITRARKSYYDVLEVPSTASIKDIKIAYRKKALKLHPDVNPAPDAKEAFMQAKEAFETLSDEAKRSTYDKKIRFGGGGFDDTTNDPSSWYRDFSAEYQRGKQANASKGQEAEDKYGFEDFFKDLDKEIDTWSQGREGRKGGRARSSSLWEELEAIGEEFVEFIEETVVGSEEVKSSDRNWSKETSEPKASAPPPPPPPRQSTASSSKSPPPPSIDDELAALKKKLGKI